MTAAARIDELARYSRRSAISSAVGLAVLAGSLVLSTVTLARLETRRADLESDIANLDAQKTQTETALQQAIQKLNEQSQLISGPLAQVAHPQASSNPVRGAKTPQGWQLYDFIVSVDVPEVRKSEIKEVEYHFDDPTVHNKIQVSGDAATDYAVSYRGYGCFPLMLIDLVLKNETTVPLYFDQCKALGFTVQAPASNSH